MLFCMCFFDQDTLCPDGISETMVRHHWDARPDSEKWFNVPDHQDDCWDMALYVC